MEKKIRILVVDDDPHLRKTVGDILRLKGYQPITAASGAEAVAAAGEGISLALIDLRLPDISGLDLMEKIRAAAPLSEAVILTGHASMDTAIEATRRGAFSYLQKPYQMEDLLLTIRHGVERQQAREEIQRLASHPRLNPSPVIEIDLEGRVTYFNPAAARLFPDLESAGARHPTLAGITEPGSHAPAEGDEAIGEVEAGGATYERHVYYVAESRLLRVHLLDVTTRKRAEADARTRLEELTRSHQELLQLNERLKQAQSQLIQAEKMASIGVLAAGVAHEINNPIGYISANLGTLEEYVNDFLTLLAGYERLEQVAPPASPLLAEVSALKRRLDLEFLRNDVTSLLHESQQGIDRVKHIVGNLKEFSHTAREELWNTEDIHGGLESALTMVWNELKYKCRVNKEYAQLPPVECLLPELNQVFMNLLVNAGQAIEEKGEITVRTGTDEERDRVWIEIEDDGKGIAPEHLTRIFEPFFTTKPVGKGTGLGLSVSYNIVQKHHGEITVLSKPGAGTSFRIWLPVKQPHAAEPASAATSAS